MKLRLTSIAIATYLAAAAGGVASAQTVVKIGHVAPLTGSIAHLGKDNEMGGRLAIDELNSKKLTIGGKEVRFELLGEDDAADPKQGTAAAQKLVDEGVVGVVGHLNSGTSIPASRIYKDAGIPQVSPSSTAPQYTKQGFKTTFRIVANDGQLGGVLGQYAVKEMGAKNFGIIDDRTAYGQGVADEFEKAVKAAGGNVVGREFTNDKATDFNAILTKLKGQKPDVIFYGGMDAVAGPMMRQMRQLGMDVRFMGGDGICTVEMAKLAGDAVGEGKVVCAEAGGVTPDKAAALEDFKKRFNSKFNANVQLYAPYVYDAVNLLVAAMQKADSTDPEKYLPELAKIEYDGITGHIAFDERGDMKKAALTLYTFKGGQKTQMMVVQ
ncbi:MAG: branched-chain amino acid ABC transporter substrate-binding protein [Limnobacter sp.]|nr:branched-chain amino acid ABC transporter substrate-binding protein [Limnobacter sp.]